MFVSVGVADYDFLTIRPAADAAYVCSFIGSKWASRRKNRAINSNSGCSLRVIHGVVLYSLLVQLALLIS